MADLPSPLAARAKARLRQVVPFVGAAVLLGYFLWSTDLPAVGRALALADFGQLFAVVAGGSTLIWLYDSLCLVWLVRRTLGHRGVQTPVGLRALAPVKAASYVINIVNYHAASLGMAWLIGRRKGVPFLEAAGALAVLSYIDLVAVAGMAVAGLQLAPEMLGGREALQDWVQAVSAVIFGVALAVLLLLQSGWQLPLLVKLRQLPLLRPVASLGPIAMLQGIVLRAGIVLAYTVNAVLLMRAFGMAPDWGRMFVAVPVLTVVGTVPISVAGIGTTQVLMRGLYAPFVVDGRAPGPVIDAFSTSMIVGYIAWRMVLAAPFLRAILAELRGEKPSGPT